MHNVPNHVENIERGFNLKPIRCLKCGSIYPSDRNKCPSCNCENNSTNASSLPAEPSEIEKASNARGYTPVFNNRPAAICCRKCGSDNIVPITEVATKGKDFKVGAACGGFLLFGPIGLLCGKLGKGKRITSTTYWICKDCGKKFRA